MASRLHRFMSRIDLGVLFLIGLLGAGVAIGLISFACAQVCP